jgi:hypothetical protein
VADDSKGPNSLAAGDGESTALATNRSTGDVTIKILPQEIGEPWSVSATDVLRDNRTPGVK